MELVLIVLCCVFLGVQAEPARLEIEIPDIARRNYCIQMSKDIRVRAMLDALAWGEGTDHHPLVKTSKEGYSMSYCGKIGSFIDHPRVRCCFPHKDKDLCSDAAGRYMCLSKTWDWVRERLGLTDFGPAQQDIVAVFLLDVCGALKLLMVNDVRGAIHAASRFWAPMPGNTYGQPQKKLNETIAFYHNRLTLHESLKKGQV